MSRPPLARGYASEASNVAANVATIRRVLGDRTERGAGSASHVRGDRRTVDTKGVAPTLYG
jgi:hypothetical protein